MNEQKLKETLTKTIDNVGSTLNSASSTFKQLRQNAFKKATFTLQQLKKPEPQTDVPSLDNAEHQEPQSIQETELQEKRHENNAEVHTSKIKFTQPIAPTNKRRTPPKSENHKYSIFDIVDSNQPTKDQLNFFKENIDKTKSEKLFKENEYGIKISIFELIINKAAAIKKEIKKIKEIKPDMIEESNIQYGLLDAMATVDSFKESLLYLDLNLLIEAIHYSRPHLGKYPNTLYLTPKEIAILTGDSEILRACGLSENEIDNIVKLIPLDSNGETQIDRILALDESEEDKIEKLNGLLTENTINIKNSMGLTPLLAAVSFGQFKVALRLLEKGANPEIAGLEKRTILHMLAIYQQNSIENESYGDYIALLDALLPNFDVSKIDEKGLNALQLAINYSNFYMVRKYYAYRRMTEESRQNALQHALQIASRVEEQTDKNLNSLDPYLSTIITYLQENMLDDEGNIVKSDQQNGHISNRRPGIYIKSKKPFKPRNSQFTPLRSIKSSLYKIITVSHFFKEINEANEENIIEKFKSEKYKLHIRDHQNNSPFHAAINNEKYRLVRELVNLAFTQDFNINSVNLDGDTVFHLLARQIKQTSDLPALAEIGNIFKLLRNSAGGFDPELANNQNETVVSILEEVDLEPTGISFLFNDYINKL